jgi:hypothetical protein
MRGTVSRRGAAVAAAVAVACACCGRAADSVVRFADYYLYSNPAFGRESSIAHTIIKKRCIFHQVNHLYFLKIFEKEICRDIS